MSIKKYLEEIEDLSGKKVLIAGGTAGIGLSIVRHLLYKHADVVILARSENKFNFIKSTLLETYPDGHIEFVKYDQSNDQSVKLAAHQILQSHCDFYALILNAGIIQSSKNITQTDGYPTTIKTNYVGIALLLKYLVPHLKEGQRVIFQGSLCAGFRLGRIDSLKEQKPRMFRLYFLSKAGIEALFYHYNKQDNIAPSFYLVEPGITKSEITRDFIPFIRVLGKIVLTLFSHSTDKAALTAIKALDSKVEKGAYIVPRGLFAYCGYPKIKAFPRRRQREYLVEMLDEQYR